MTTIKELVNSTITDKQSEALRPILKRLFLTDNRTVQQAVEDITSSGLNIGVLLRKDNEVISSNFRELAKALSSGAITTDERILLESYEVSQRCLYPEYFNSDEYIAKVQEHIVPCFNGAGFEKEVLLSLFESSNGHKFTTLVAPPYKAFDEGIHMLLDGHVTTI